MQSCEVCYWDSIRAADCAHSFICYTLHLIRRYCRCLAYPVVPLVPEVPCVVPWVPGASYSQWFLPVSSSGVWDSYFPLVPQVACGSLWLLCSLGCWWYIGFSIVPLVPQVTSVACGFLWSFRFLGFLRWPVVPWIANGLLGSSGYLWFFVDSTCSSGS